MVLWKQMRSLELAAALVAETLMEMGVKIFTNPEEIHWPNGNITKPSSPASKKKTGKTKQKNKHGVYGQLVSDLAPKIPKGQAASDAACSQKDSKGNAPTRGKNKKQKTTEEQVIAVEHEGLPVQPRNCKLWNLFLKCFFVPHQNCLLNCWFYYVLF